MSKKVKELKPEQMLALISSKSNDQERIKVIVKYENKMNGKTLGKSIGLLKDLSTTKEQLNKYINSDRFMLLKDDILSEAIKEKKSDNDKIELMNEYESQIFTDDLDNIICSIEDFDLFKTMLEKNKSKLLYNIPYIIGARKSDDEKIELIDTYYKETNKEEVLYAMRFIKDFNKFKDVFKQHINDVPEGIISGLINYKRSDEEKAELIDICFDEFKDKKDYNEFMKLIGDSIDSISNKNTRNEIIKKIEEKYKEKEREKEKEEEQAKTNNKSFEQLVSEMEYSAEANLGEGMVKLSYEMQLEELDKRIEPLKAKLEKEGHLSIRESIRLSSLTSRKNHLAQVLAKKEEKDDLISERQSRRETKMDERTSQIEETQTKLEEQRKKEHKSHLGRYLSNRKANKLENKIKKLQVKRGILVEKQKASVLRSLKIQKALLKLSSARIKVASTFGVIANEVKNIRMDVHNVRSNPERINDLANAEIIAKGGETTEVVHSNVMTA